MKVFRNRTEAAHSQIALLQPQAAGAGAALSSVD